MYDALWCTFVKKNLKLNSTCPIILLFLLSNQPLDVHWFAFILKYVCFNFYTLQENISDMFISAFNFNVQIFSCPFYYSAAEPSKGHWGFHWCYFVILLHFHIKMFCFLKAIVMLCIISLTEWDLFWTTVFTYWNRMSCHILGEVVDIVWLQLNICIFYLTPWLWDLYAKAE